MDVLEEQIGAKDLELKEGGKKSKPQNEFSTIFSILHHT